MDVLCSAKRISCQFFQNVRIGNFENNQNEKTQGSPDVICFPDALNDSSNDEALGTQPEVVYCVWLDQYLETIGYGTAKKR